MKTLLYLITAATAAASALPSVGPDYRRPPVDTPDSYRDAGPPELWKIAQPSDALGRGDWWSVFRDPSLDILEKRALRANQDLHAAAARVEQARAAAGIARSSAWPQVAFEPSALRERTSATVGDAFPVLGTTTYTVPLTATWEIDLFGRVRRLSESARADAEASAAAFESVRLSLAADVAATYFALRATDRESVVVDGTVALRRREDALIRSRLGSGTATELDAARADAELAAADADAAALANRRAQLQDALAVLVGEAASAFALAPSQIRFDPPAVPPGLPADLLERRPDVAAAERTLAAANARIGVAKAAFFPAISLTGGAGYASGAIDRLFEADSRIWSFGPSLYLPIFQGGRNRANLERSRGAYDEAVAAYRQRVLVAFREVQDALTATRLLARESAAQDRDLAAARRAASLAKIRYDAGYVSYLEVIDAQRTSLAAERAAAQLAGTRMETSVALIKALGGCWRTPSPTRLP